MKPDDTGLPFSLSQVTSSIFASQERNSRCSRAANASFVIRMTDVKFTVTYTKLDISNFMRKLGNDFTPDLVFSAGTNDKTGCVYLEL